MKKILCPTDFSETAQNAIAYAAKFTKASDSMLTLLNVQPANSPALVAERELVVNAVGERLEELSREVRQFFKISCEIDVIQSPRLLSDAIAERAEDYSLIIMGSHGVENLMEFFTGSNTYHAILKSKVPVLLIPPECTFGKITNVVFAYNYLSERKLPIKQLQPWIKSLQCELTVLEVNEEAVSQDAADEMKELQYIISEQWGSEDIKVNFDSIRSADIAPSINSYIHRNESDVLALCTKHRNFIQRLFHKSVIKVISEIANYPVLVIHDDDD
jgi:nucleotide-binding universal stress UspA family protein